jgi:hypothetical protein
MLSQNYLARNIDFISRSDQGGRGDGCQIMVHRGYAYIGHLFSNGFTILDVRDPRKPRTVDFIPAPPQTWSLHVQTHEDLLFVVNALDMYNLPIFFEESEYHSKSVIETLDEEGYSFTAGLRVYDISDPEKPREIGFMPVDGFGLHRMWYIGGRYLYASAHIRGYTDYVLLIIDVSDPTKPHEIGRYWLPGMWAAGGEKPSWPRGRRFSAHHALVPPDSDIAYSSWRDGGMALLDISDKTKPRLIAHQNLSPPFGGGTHTTLPLPDRQLILVADESIADNCADGIKYIWVVDVREPANPVTIATMPLPEEDDYCKQPGHFGPHNLHEMRPGSWQESNTIFATLQNAGVRAYDIRNPFAPKELAYFVPPFPETIVDPRPRPVGVNTTDVYVDPNGLMYVTDYNAGLYILEYTGG